MLRQCPRALAGVLGVPLYQNVIYSAIPCNQRLTTLNAHRVFTPEQRRRHSYAQESKDVAAMLKKGRNFNRSSPYAIYKM